MIDERITQANNRLKAARVGVSIERRGGTLWLRGTLPPKPGSSKTEPFRQKHSLGVKANPAGLQHAEGQARLMGAELQLGKFDWSNWLKTQPHVETGTVSHWIAKYEQDYWRRRARTQQSETTWKTDYEVIFRKLPQNEGLSKEVLLQVIDSTEADSRQRKRSVQVLSRLAKFAELEVDLTNLVGSYSPKRVNPRLLPSDKVIMEVREAVKNEAWCWVIGAIACWGLRPHEVFHLDLSEFPVAQISDETKTGERFVYPLYPEWAEMWKLDQVKLPNFQKNHSNAKLGTKVSGEFQDRKIPFKAYDLRHCFARRCFEFSLPPDWAASLMGHSLQVHKTTYRAWIDQVTYRKAYETLINRTNRPTPPNVSLLE